MTQQRNYANTYQASIDNPEAFWLEQTRQIDWFQAPSAALNTDQNGFYRWFKGGSLNTAHLALDYHVANGRAQQTAIIYDSPVTNTVQRYTYAELLDKVARLAGALQTLGVQKGDTVVIYMPMDLIILAR